MTSSSCAICQSPLRTEIENKASRWNSTRTVQWARNQGVRISCSSLAKHKTRHIEAPLTETPIVKIEEIQSADLPVATEARSITQIASPKTVSDQLFLDKVRDMVYGKLLDGEIELKLDAAFKAIELKYKIAEESQNEKLLLEILNEIRTEELKKSS